MKKQLLTAIAATAVALLPLAGHAALKAAADDELQAVTGQAGVSIAVDNVDIDLSIGNVAWGDSDGINGQQTNDLIAGTGLNAGNAGFVNINGIAVTGLSVDSIPNRAGTAALALTIDVGSVTDATTSADATLAAFGSDATSAVNIGLPTVAVGIDQITVASISVDRSANPAVAGPSFGSLQINDVSLRSYGGSVQIFAH